MVRLVLLLIIIGALTIFVVQNALPALPLTFLGMKTVAVPLGIWVVGAIAAGALTTVLFSVLFNVSGSAAASRARRARPTAQQTVGGGNPTWKPPSWTSRGTDTPRDTARATSARSSDDDWERGSSDEWDDWGSSTPSGTAPRAAQAASYQPPYESSYADRRFEQRPYQEPVFQEQDEWDDWEEEEIRDSGRAEQSQPEEPEPPPKKIVEVNRSPATRSQSGTVYSYTYRPADEAVPPPKEPEPPRKESIYDAEFRVIMPPSQEVPDEVPPEVEDPPTSQQNTKDEWEDWEDLDGSKRP